MGANATDLSLFESHNSNGNYVALSYCWGANTAMLKTTSSTIERYRSRIPFFGLPKTLQDAITISHALGVHYIWIDCLCIVQDMQEDWRQEAAQMGAYYQNAIFTIAASSATAADEGIFVERAEVSNAMDVAWLGKDSTFRELTVQYRKPKPIHDRDFSMEDLGPISQRAWTFQEHALSWRVLHFTSNELIWECQSHVIGEDGHEIRKNEISLIREFRKDVEQDPVRSWHKFIERYSGRDLAIPNDRLAAIAGLAKRRAQVTNSHYMAGLWSESLAIDLLWLPEEHTTTPVPGTPSWSWISVLGRVQFQLPCHRKRYRSFIKGHFDGTMAENNYTDVTSRALVLTGPLQKASISYEGGLGKSSFRLQIMSVDGKVHSSLFHPDSLLECDRAANSTHEEVNIVRRTDKPAGPFTASVHCLWCYTHYEPTKNFDRVPCSRLEGIVLSETTTGQFTRIGTASHWELKLLHVYVESWEAAGMEVRTVTIV
jgi:hypothetical protein